MSSDGKAEVQAGIERTNAAAREAVTRVQRLVERLQALRDDADRQKAVEVRIEEKP